MSKFHMFWFCSVQRQCGAFEIAEDLRPTLFAQRLDDFFLGDLPVRQKFLQRRAAAQT